MRSDVFYWLLNMSLSGGAVLLIVLLLRRLRVLPRGFVFALLFAAIAAALILN